MAPATVSRERVQGQWIWSARDRELFERAHEAQPSLAAAVFVATITSELPRWASTLGYLSAHALHGVELWITSLPVHVQQGNYSALMRGVVIGHIIQVFDTGLG